MELDSVLITLHTSWYPEQSVYDLQAKAGNIIYQELLKANKF